jgi:hypothetical protein
MRLRFSVRRLMVVVAAVALLLGGSIAAYRLLGAALYHRRQAQMYALAEADTLQELARQEQRVTELKQQGDSQAGTKLAMHTGLAELARRRATYFAAMKRKYKVAASRPWVSVPTDPPPPGP